MGAYLSQPITEKETVEGEGTAVRYAVCSMQGWRRTMEDGETIDGAELKRCCLSALTSAAARLVVCVSMSEAARASFAACPFQTLQS